MGEETPEAGRRRFGIDQNWFHDAEK